jgi:CBS domain-containing protein
MITVSEVMTKKVRTLKDSASFSQIVRFLVKHNISGAPVINSEGKLVGVISEKDLFRKLFPTQKDFYKNMEYYFAPDRIEKESNKVVKLTARNFMSKKIISVSPDDKVIKACSLLLIHSIRRLPVVKDGKLVGIVTTNNLYKNYPQKLV